MGNVARRLIKHRITVALVIVALLTPGLPAPSAMAAPEFIRPSFADPAFARIWDRLDRPVHQAEIARSYTWGGQRSDGIQEEYRQGPQGFHLVQYFDKSRMEINSPDADPNDPFYVTQGLLARDMIRGQFQVGNTVFQTAPQGPAQVPFGDLDDTGAASPTYASFINHLQAALVPAGQPIVARLARNGEVTNEPALAARGVTSRGVLPGTPPTAEGFNQHAIASVFLDFIESRGPIFNGTANEDGALFAPLQYVFGYPITEAHWATVKAAGVPREVLIQCFERRCLTYAPSNEPAYRVELANTGLQYFDWRYRQAAPAPGGTYTPARAATLGTDDADPMLLKALLPLPNNRLLLLGDGGMKQWQRYDRATDSWSAPRALLEPRRTAFALVTLNNGSILAIGGFVYSQDEKPGKLLASVERYDPTTDSWNMIASLRNGRADAAAVTLPDGRVLVSGGDSGGPKVGQYIASAEVYDPADNSWTPVAGMTQARSNHQLVPLRDGRVLALFGSYNTGLPGETPVEIFDPRANRWQPAAVPPRGAIYETAVLTDGRVLAIAQGAPLPGLTSPTLTTAIYDPGTDRWQRGAPLPSSIGDPSTRQYFTFTPLRDGTYLVAGGRISIPQYRRLSTGPGDHRTPEQRMVDDAARYDPANDRWLTDRPLPRPSEHHVAAPFADGSVFFYDPYNPNINSPRDGKAYIYTPPAP